MIPRSGRLMRSNSLRNSIAPAVERLEGRVLLSTYTVTNLNDSGPGSLRDAVQQANAHAGADAINFAPGLRGTITLTTGEVTIDADDLAITGPGPSAVAVSGALVVDRPGSIRGVRAEISGLTIAGVNGDVPGTQITLTDCTVGSVETWDSVAIERCTISRLLDHGNGGFDVSESTIHGAELPYGSDSFTNCMITGSSGDGIDSADEGSTVTLTRCTVSGNAGAGIDTVDGWVNVIDSTISGNGGAGIAGTDQPELFVSGTTIANNQGTGITYGGGGSAGLHLTNSTVTNNMGGGVDAGGVLTVTNSTIVNNGGTIVGGIGIMAGSLGYTNRIDNTIVAGNRNSTGASDIGAPGQITLTGSNNLIGTGGSGGLVNGQNGNIVGVEDPLLAPLGNYGGPTQTMPPLVGSLATTGSSPAIDAGSNALAVGPDGKPLTSDQRGYPRVYNGKVDIGAAEFGFASANPVVTNLNDSGPGSLMQAILDTNIRIGPDTITFAPGLTGTIPGYEPTITDNLTIAGPGASVLAVNGGFSLDVYASTSSPLSQAALNASGLTISGEISDPYPPGTSVTLTDCTLPGVDSWGSLVIRRCTISGGRGILANGLFDISDSTISNCANGAGDVAGDTAAIIVPRGGGGYLTHCTITANPGDGIWTTSGIVTLTRCTVSDNNADGMYTDDENIEVIDSTVSGNGSAGISGTSQASFGVFGSTIANNKGSGITYSGQLRLNNSTVANNMGGGIDVTGGLGTVLLRVTNSTIVGNVGTNVGGVSVGGGAVINNTIVAGNRDANGASDLVAFHPVTGSNDLIGAGGSGGLVNGQNGNIVGVADPMLAPLGNYGGPTQTMPPLAGSPAIDAGNNALAVDANGKPLIGDQRGYYRIVNSKVDIGAVEFNSTPIVPGDANGDGTVNFADLLIVAQNYGTQHDVGWPAGDFTGDGAVNFDDLLVLAQHYNKTRSPASSAARR